MMELIIRLSQGKGISDDASSMNTRSYWRPYVQLLSSHLTYNTRGRYSLLPYPTDDEYSSRTCPSPLACIPYGRVYTYPCIPPSLCLVYQLHKPKWTLGLFLPNQCLLKVLMIKRNRKERIWSYWCNLKIQKTQLKVSLIEERLKAIERNSLIKGMDALELSLLPTNSKCSTL